MTILIRFVVTPIIIGFAGYAILDLVTRGTLDLPTDYTGLSTLLIFIGSVFVGILLTGANFSATQPTENELASHRETGTVKWFNPQKGFGFITCDQGDEIFVHYRSLEGSPGRHAIAEGQRVSFVTTDSEKGLQADEVVIL